MAEVITSLFYILKYLKLYGKENQVFVSSINKAT